MQSLPLYFLNLEHAAKEQLDKKGIKTIDELIRQRKAGLIDIKSQTIDLEIEKYEYARSSMLKTLKEPRQRPEVKKTRTQFLSYLVCDESSSISEIYGQKASGKTTLLMQLIKHHQKVKPQNQILFLNCSSGITHQRYESIRKNLIYRDVFSVNDIGFFIEQAMQKEPNLSLIVADDPIKFFKVREKPEVQFTKWILNMKDLAAKHKIDIVYSNYTILDTIRMFNDEHCYNQASEFSSSTSPLLDYRVSTQRLPTDTFIMVLLKAKRHLTAQKVRHYLINSSGMQYIDKHFDKETAVRKSTEDVIIV